MNDNTAPQEGPTVTVSSKHTERLKDLRQFIIGWRELDWPEGFDRFTAQTIADEVEKRFPKNDAPDLAPAPLPALDRDWPIKEFQALLDSKSRYLFYLHQWVPYQDVGMLRLKLFHDAKTFDGRIAMHIWPNGNHCGPFIDSEVEFIRISLDQGWGTQEQDK